MKNYGIEFSVKFFFFVLKKNFIIIYGIFLSSFFLYGKINNFTIYNNLYGI